MAKSEVIVNESLCLGCGYCEHYCPKGAITIDSSKFGHQGHLMASFSNPEACTACGICGWMCPHFAIEVYKLVEPSAS